MRVAINLEQLLLPAPGGIGRYAAQLIKRLPRLQPDAAPPEARDEYLAFCARHRADVVTAAFRRFDLDDIEPKVLPLPRTLLFNAWQRAGLLKLGRLHPDLQGLDVVHAPSIGIPPRGPHALVVTLHDATPLLFPDSFDSRALRFHRAGLNAVRRRADVIIAVSESARKDICTRSDIDPNRVRVVYNGVEPVHVPRELVEATLRREGLDDRPFVFWVGIVEERKNVGTLVRAFKQLVDEGELDHRLVLLDPSGWNGFSPADANDAVADAAALGDRLRLLGRVDEPTLNALYRGADVFAFPSLHEGFGLPILEAMIQGTPVVCSDTSAMPEIAGDAAVLAPPDDVASWTSALWQAISDGDLRAVLAQRGPKRAREFSWARTARRTQQIYAQAAHGA